MENILTNEFAEKVKNKALTGEEKAELKQLYEKVTRKELNKTCSNCYLDSWFELNMLKSGDPDRFEALLTGTSRLKAGAVLDFEGGHVTNYNLTDASARAILAANPVAAKFFAVLPEVEEAKTEETPKKRKR